MVWDKIREQPSQNYTRRPYQRTCQVTCSKTKIYAMLAESQQKTTFTQQTSVSDAKDKSSQEKDVVFTDQKLHQ